MDFWRKIYFLCGVVLVYFVLQKKLGSFPTRLNLNPISIEKGPKASPVKKSVTPTKPPPTKPMNIILPPKNGQPKNLPKLSPLEKLAKAKSAPSMVQQEGPSRGQRPPLKVIPYIKQDFAPYLNKVWRKQRKMMLPKRGPGVNCFNGKGVQTSFLIAFFIKIGKTGSTTLYQLLEVVLQKPNGFSLDLIEPENNILSNEDKWKHYVKEIIPKGPCPKVIVGHWRFIDFTSFNYANPIYFSLTRNPLDRLESWFYYMKDIGMAPENIKGYSFEDCLRADPRDCWMPKCVIAEHLCGHDEVCLRSCNRGDDAEIVRAAAKNVDENILVVGILEHFNMTLQVLEYLIPDYFSGALEGYERDSVEKVKNSNPHPKIERSEENKKLFCEKFSAECDLHEFLVQRLHNQYQQLSSSK